MDLKIEKNLSKINRITSIKKQLQDHFGNGYDICNLELLQEEDNKLQIKFKPVYYTAPTSEWISYRFAEVELF